MKTAKMDYMTAMLKAGWDAVPALALNNLWVKCGLTHIVIFGTRVPLRFLEEI